MAVVKPLQIQAKLLLRTQPTGKVQIPNPPLLIPVNQIQIPAVRAVQAVTLLVTAVKAIPTQAHSLLTVQLKPRTLTQTT